MAREKRFPYLQGADARTTQLPTNRKGRSSVDYNGGTTQEVHLRSSLHFAD